MKILSIQSAVAYGHVGNSAAVFPLQRIGVEVLPVYTVNFSNHTGYGAWRGPLIAPDDVREVITGIEERGVFREIDVVLSGYQGGEGIGDVILDAVARVKAANPARGLRVRPGDGQREVRMLRRPRHPRCCCASASCRPPTSSRRTSSSSASSPAPSPTRSSRRSPRSTCAARPGPRTVLVTSVERPDREEGTIEMLAVDDDGAWIVQTPLLPMKANGSGDVTAALFTAHYRRTGDAADALARTTSSVFDLLERTLESGERELQLVEAQESYAHPRMQFERAPGALSAPRSSPAALTRRCRPGLGDAAHVAEQLRQRLGPGDDREEVRVGSPSAARRAGAGARRCPRRRRAPWFMPMLKPSQRETCAQHPHRPSG